MDLIARLNLKHPLIVAPMAGGPTTPALVAACSGAGALGSLGAAYAKPSAITEMAAAVREKSARPFAINLFIPDEDPDFDDLDYRRAVRQTEPYRRELRLPDPLLTEPFREDFAAQFAEVLRLRPAVLSYVFGVLPAEMSKAAHDAGILLIGTATSLEEAQLVEESGADAVVLQGFEAGGHRGIFKLDDRDPEVPLRDLLAQTAGLKIPRIAAGGLMNAADIGTALRAGAVAVQMGTAFLACQEAGTSAPYRARLLEKVRETKMTRAFSGRLARGLRNRFINEMDIDPRAILPWPAQNKFTRDLRTAAARLGLSDFLSLWCGTGGGDLWTGPAGELIESLFAENVDSSPQR